MTPPMPLAPILPGLKTFRQFCSHDNAWSDHYGALHVAAAYAGLVMPVQYSIKAIWMHGCGGPWLEKLPSSLYLNSPMAAHWPVFVARDDEVRCLTAHGIPRVRAIGLPIAYTPEPGVTREPGSLLVMPTHTLVGDAVHDRTAFDSYADEISAVAAKFQRVVVCIHPNCQRNGLWIGEFASRGFEIVYGAQTNDANALLRMRTLFEQFEFMTTNGWGGHVAYALAFGARVSIHGTQPKRAEADLLRDTTWAADKGTLKTMLSPEVQDRMKDFLKEYYRPPEHGIADAAKGRWFIGWDNRVTRAEMRQILGTMIPHLLEHEAVIQARGQRQEARQEAARLVAAGRSAEAVQLFLGVVRSAAESKNAFLIYEALVEIAADLRTLDPQRAAKFVEQAQLLAVRIDAARRAAA